MSDTENQDLLWEIGDDGVAWLTLNRPDAANAITPDQRNRTIELMEAASGDLNVRAVVITAAGEKHFCTGADLRVSRIPVNPGPDDAPEKALGDVGRNIKRGAQRLVASIMDCEKPVIAAVNGTAAGIGAHIAFAADLVIAADNAKFIEVFVRRGITPDGGGAYMLPRLVGLQKAKELILFGRDVQGRGGRAHRAGQQGRARRRAARRGRRVGRPAGRVAHQGPDALEVAAQPAHGVVPRRRLRGRGLGPGDGVLHRRLPGGRGRLQGAPRRPLPRLVAPRPARRSRSTTCRCSDTW